MFIKKFINLVLAFALLFIGTSKVFAVDNIINTSVRKTSVNGLNFTFYTNNDVAEAPIVKDKGNNQYVILLPNLKDMSGSRPDLRTVSDLVSDINVKTVNEGAVTYTKVTLTSQKPININVETRKTSQSTRELNGVNDIIAKVNLINQDIQTSKPAQVASAGVVVNNINSVQDVLKSQEKVTPINKSVNEKKSIPQPKVQTKSVNSVKSVSAHVPSNTKAIKKETKKLQDENIKNVQPKITKNIDKIEQNIKSSIENNITVNTEESFENLENVDLEPIVMPEEDDLLNIKSFKNPLASPIVSVVFVVMLALSILIFMFKKMSAMLNRNDEFSGAFVQRLNESVYSKKRDYSQIAQNENLSWQEKYKSYKTGQVQEQKEVLNSHVGVDVDEDLDIIDEVAEDLDFQDRPLETSQINPFAANIDLLSRGIVIESGDVISSEMRKTLKGFADDKSLSKTKRNMGLKNRFTTFENANAEALERNMHELLETVIKLDEEKSALERSYNAPDAVPSVYEQVRETYQKQESVDVLKEEVKEVLNTVEQAPVNEKRKLKIRESRAIDDNKGFYLVDMNDKLALMGRINDKFTVLKKFDDVNKNTLQVRRDKDNLYMVRTNGFKALVDVNEDKMGVFAEL